MNDIHGKQSLVAVLLPFKLMYYLCRNNLGLFYTDKLIQNSCRVPTLKVFPGAHFFDVKNFDGVVQHSHSNREQHCEVIRLLARYPVYNKHMRTIFKMYLK